GAVAAGYELTAEMRDEDRVVFADDGKRTLRRLEGCQQGVGGEWLPQQPERAGLQGLGDDRLLMARHHDDPGGGTDLADLKEPVDAVHHGHAHVHQDESEGPGAAALERHSSVV